MGQRKRLSDAPRFHQVLDPHSRRYVASLMTLSRRFTFVLDQLGELQILLEGYTKFPAMDHLRNCPSVSSLGDGGVLGTL